MGLIQHPPLGPSPLLSRPSVRPAYNAGYARYAAMAIREHAAIVKGWISSVLSARRSSAVLLQPPRLGMGQQDCSFLGDDVERRHACTVAPARHDDLERRPGAPIAFRKGLVCTYSTPSTTKKRYQTADIASSNSCSGSRRSQASLPPGVALPLDSSTEEVTCRGGDLQDPSASASSPLASASLDPTTLSELVEDYFEHLYPLPSYAFLHKPTVLERCRDATLDAPLNLALCAITSLLLQRVSHYYCHDLWAQQAEQQLDALRASLRPEEQYSAANLQRCCRGLKSQFVMAHTSWHQCYCDLYRVYLPQV